MQVSNNKFSPAEDNKRKKSDAYNTRLNQSIDRLKMLCPAEWEIILDYIKSQKEFKMVREDTPGYIAARRAFAYTQVNRIYIRLNQQEENE